MTVVTASAHAQAAELDASGAERHLIRGSAFGWRRTEGRHPSARTQGDDAGGSQGTLKKLAAAKMFCFHKKFTAFALMSCRRAEMATKIDRKAAWYSNVLMLNLAQDSLR
jgi:hypothetical protein